MPSIGQSNSQVPQLLDFDPAASAFLAGPTSICELERPGLPWPRVYATPPSASSIHAGSTIRGVGPGGSNPLAPTTYEYSHLRRQRRREAVADGMRAKVDGRLLHAQDVDPVEQGAREELAA